jgi:biopolymer transport protein ExbD
MTIHEPGKRLMHAIPLKFVQKKVSGHGGRSVAAELSLTSMIDFLVTIVVFLLMTFSASGETSLPNGITLPSAEHTIDLLDAPMVAITADQILVNGQPMGNTRSVVEANKVQKIDELFNSLKGQRDVYKQLNPNKDFPGVVILTMDAKVPAVVVKSVFQTAAFAGFPNVSFMVNKTGGKKPAGGGGGGE